MTSVGRKDLLVWASGVLGRTIVTFEDLRTGSIFVNLLHAILPASAGASMDRVREPTRSEADVRHNWGLVASALRVLHIPLGVGSSPDKRSRHRLYYQLLVALYFLHSLGTRHDFSVELAEAVDDSLAAFLQSPDSVHCLARGASLSASPARQQQPPKVTTPTHSVGPPVVSLLPIPPTLHQPLDPQLVSWLNEEARRDGEATLQRIRNCVSSLESQVTLLREELSITEQQSDRLTQRAILLHDAGIHWEAASLHHTRCEIQIKWENARYQEQQRFEMEVNKVVEEQCRLLAKESAAFRNRARLVMDEIVQSCLVDVLARVRAQEAELSEILQEEERHAVSLEKCWAQIVGTAGLHSDVDAEVAKVRIRVDEANTDLRKQRLAHTRRVEALRQGRTVDVPLGAKDDDHIVNVEAEIQAAQALRAFLSDRDGGEHTGELWGLVTEAEEAYQRLARTIEAIDKPNGFIDRALDNVRLQWSAEGTSEAIHIESDLATGSVDELRRSMRQGTVLTMCPPPREDAHRTLRELCRKYQRAAGALQLRESLWQQAIERQRRVLEEGEKNIASVMHYQQALSAFQLTSYSPEPFEVVTLGLQESLAQDVNAQFKRLQQMLDLYMKSSGPRRKLMLEVGSAQHEVDTEKALLSVVQAYERRPFLCPSPQPNLQIGGPPDQTPSQNTIAARSASKLSNAMTEEIERMKRFVAHLSGSI